MVFLLPYLSVYQIFKKSMPSVIGIKIFFGTVIEMYLTSGSRKAKRVGIILKTIYHEKRNIFISKYAYDGFNAWSHGKY